MTKISQLPEDLAPTTSDYIPTVDFETGLTKKVTLLNIISNFFKIQNISNPYKFSASLGTSQTISSAATWTPVNADTLEYDTNSNYNTSSYTYTIPITGYYLFTASLQFLSQSGSPVLCSISKNSTTIEYRRFAEIPNTTGNVTLSGAIECYLVAGDVIRFMAYTGQSKVINAGVTQTRWSGRLVAV